MTSGGKASQTDVQMQKPGGGNILGHHGGSNLGEENDTMRSESQQGPIRAMIFGDYLIYTLRRDGKPGLEETSDTI